MFCFLIKKFKPTDYNQRIALVIWLLHLDAILFKQNHLHIGWILKQTKLSPLGEKFSNNFRKIITYTEMNHWCAFWAGAIIGPFFFEDANKSTVTISGGQYKQMKKIFCWLNLRKQIKIIVNFNRIELQVALT